MEVSVGTMQLTLYGGDYVVMQVTTSVEFRKVLRWYFVTGMLVDLCVAIMQVTVSVAVMQLEVFAAHTRVTVSAANMWVKIIVVTMQMEVSCCNYAGGIFCSALFT